MDLLQSNELHDLTYFGRIIQDFFLFTGRYISALSIFLEYRFPILARQQDFGYKETRDKINWMGLRNSKFKCIGCGNGDLKKSVDRDGLTAMA